MTCIICNQPTKTGDAYLLPRIVEDDKGGYINQVACSAEHRREWLNQNTEMGDSNDNQDFVV